MTNRPPHHDQFLKDLRRLWRRCGSPAFAKMEETSASIPMLYEHSERIRDLPRLSRAGISAVLAGERDKVPDGGWVAAYVVTCLHLGWSVCAVEEPPTEAVILKWQYKRFLACDGTPPEDAREADAGMPDLPLSAPIMEDPVDVEIPRLNADERAHVAQSGAGGRLLLDAYANGDPNACYQIAVLLAAYGRTGTSHGLLLYAAVADHPMAAELLNDPDDLADPGMLAFHADMIASTAVDPPITAVFHECAHACRNRHAEPGSPAAS